MLVCNETVAEHYYWLNMPFVYRVHEDPDEEKMYEFSKFIHNFGYSLKGNVVHPKELQQLLNKIKDKREESIINNMMLRSLKKLYIHRMLQLTSGWLQNTTAILHHP